MVYIGYFKFSLTVPWANSLKDRRQIAQKCRDKVKASYNASVKLDYGDDIRRFDLYVSLLAEDKDYLSKCAAQIEGLFDEKLSLGVSSEVDIESW